MQAEHYLWKTKSRTFDRDTGLAGERDFEAAAQAKAVNDGDRRNF
jgi:hypothetical protein